MRLIGFVYAFVLAGAITCNASEPLRMHIAQRLDGEQRKELADVPWERVTGELADYWLKFGWTDGQLSVGIKLDDAAMKAGRYFHFCLDFENDSDFAYQEDDYHFSVSLPDEHGQLSFSLVRTGGSPVEPKEVMQGQGRHSGQGWEIELSADLGKLSERKLREGTDLGMKFELKQAPGPNPLPIHWGDLLLGDSSGEVARRTLQRAQEHQLRAEERFERHQADPDAPHELSPGTKEDLRRVRERIVQAQQRELDRAELRGYLNSQQEDGSWQDIRYYHSGAPDAEGGWEHMNRLLELAVSVRFSDFGEEARAALYRGLDYWFEEGFVFKNWWRNEIGVPLQMGRIALLDEALSEPRKERIVEVMKRAKRAMTGQNLVWINKVTAMRGVLEGNPALVERAFGRIEDTVRVTAGEGVQSDFSFHQHGALLYSHGYGADFAIDATQTYYWSQGGQFEMSRETLALLEDMLLEGNRWMARGLFADFAALGRNVVRPESSARYLAEAASTLLDADADRKEELRQLIAATRDYAADELEGNRYFHRSEFMVHRRPQYYASVNVYSQRMSGTESLNGEGLKSYYLPDGATLFLRRGDEYEGLLPIWNWRKIPGATIPVPEESKRPVEFPKAGSKGGSDFAGGVSDGWVGCVGYDYRKDGVHAKKAYFGFDWGLVCLGADIDWSRGGKLQTTVNQTRLNGEVAIGGAQGVKALLELGERQVEGDVRWVSHDGFVYFFPEGQRVEVVAQRQQGSWRELSRRESELPLSGEVLTVSVEHDSPETSRYVYGVVADAYIDSAEAFAEEPRFTVLENTGQVQAVADRAAGVFGAVFYEGGTVPLDVGYSVKVDRRCAVLLRKSAEGTFLLTLASPARETGGVTVTIEKADTGQRLSLELELPGNLHDAGGSVSGEIEF
ncbi:polysaccharide lyase family 8 super-sandwich domain-containing protein [Pelagicoccus sp. SDUM812002]|uniref:polysaccharide lyase family 8 super-sandwich domain-containing protein n=1 Tax=Pelagicoccus sp. SDUM812002 TaxID=3041266 RepID=UPI00280DC4D9|nr:polysaccharide lyase family 8 super-sandwich domain-containing protein [Pelagicoccus sp. SDUM812002]MDQ8187801.1 polysaccharide lyase family 8 super-sandwich domain-containing protein [Pelagicoccus sp. SDUM812002]